MIWCRYFPRPVGQIFDRSPGRNDIKTFLWVEEHSPVQSHLFIDLGKSAGYENLCQLILSEAVWGGEKALQTCHLHVVVRTVSKHSPSESSIYLSHMFHSLHWKADRRTSRGPESQFGSHRVGLTGRTTNIYSPAMTGMTWPPPPPSPPLPTAIISSLSLSWTGGEWRKGGQ